MFCGDINARIGKMLDFEVDIDTNLPARVPIDLTENSHGKQFVDFLKNSKLCVLNGRFNVNLDNFTSIGRGKSVVDYLFCPHSMLEMCSDFAVHTCKDMATRYDYAHLIGSRSKLPDHSLLKVNINILAISSPPIDLPRPDTDGQGNSTDVKYNVKNIPSDFFTSDEARDSLINLINAQELAIECQDTVNRYYNELLSSIFKEMDQYLPKIYGTGPKSKKRFKVKKPYWNEHLKNLWSDMCKKEKDFLNYRGTNHVKRFLRNLFTESSKIFHRALRKAERTYNKTTQNKIESICTDNPRQFWQYIKKLGPKYTPDIPQEVYDDDGNIITDIDSVLSKWKRDYENLYKSDQNLFDNDFYNNILQLLSNAENRMNDPLYTPNYELNKNITAQEVNFVVDKLKNNKSPGIDKIPNEVLKSITIT